jgi:hypothetical protein
MSKNRHPIDPIAAQKLIRTARAGSPLGADRPTAAASPARSDEFAGEERPGWRCWALVSQLPPS